MIGTSYAGFLVASAAALGSAGGEILLAADAPSRPPWAQGWDQVVLLDNPGAPALYAFTRLDDPSAIQARLDLLASGISGGGFLGRGPLGLIAVVVGDGEGGAGRLTRLTPRTYYAGLRPATWVVDLRRGTVTGGGFRRSDGFNLIRQAVREPGAVVADVGAARARYAGQRTAFYRLMRGRQPAVTYVLIAVNAAIYLALYLVGGPQDAATLSKFGALVPRLIEGGQWWRLFSSMFLHASVPHILFNMTSLFVIGTLAERLYGSVRFLAIYLGAGLIGSLTSFLFAVATNNLDVVGVGASGAIFGVAGALVTVRYQPSDVIPLALRKRVSTSILPLVILSLIMSYLTPYVDNSAHVGGLLGGAVLSFVFPLVRNERGMEQ